MSKHLFAIVRLMKLFFNNYLQRNLPTSDNIYYVKQLHKDYKPQHGRRQVLTIFFRHYVGLYTIRHYV